MTKSKNLKSKSEFMRQTTGGKIADIIILFILTVAGFFTLYPFIYVFLPQRNIVELFADIVRRNYKHKAD